VRLFPVSRLLSSSPNTELPSRLKTGRELSPGNFPLLPMRFSPCSSPSHRSKRSSQVGLRSPPVFPFQRRLSPEEVFPFPLNEFPPSVPLTFLSYSSPFKVQCGNLLRGTRIRPPRVPCDNRPFIGHPRVKAFPEGEFFFLGPSVLSSSPSSLVSSSWFGRRRKVLFRGRLSSSPRCSILFLDRHPPPFCVGGPPLLGPREAPSRRSPVISSNVFSFLFFLMQRDLFLAKKWSARPTTLQPVFFY